MTVYVYAIVCVDSCRLESMDAMKLDTGLEWLWGIVLLEEKYMVHALNHSSPLFCSILFLSF